MKIRFTIFPPVHTGSPIPLFSLPMYIFRVVLVLGATQFIAGQGMSQTIWHGLHTGGMNYQGELRDRNLTLQGSRWLQGTNIILASPAGFHVSVNYTYGMLSGQDVENDRYVTRRRNLHFETNFHEFSIMGRQRLGRTRTTLLSPYFAAGAALFRINPYTYDAIGKKWALFPLSTEGQGLSAYPGIWSTGHFFLSVPMGVGVEVKVSRHLRADIEFLARKTFTDRIDDVSGRYPDENLLLSEKGFKAVELSYRADELLYESPYFPAEGTLRGNPATKDNYYSLQISCRYLLRTWSNPIERVRYLFRGADWPYRF